jgi:hypothetical protein
MDVPSPKRVLESWSALIGVAGSTYLSLLDDLGVEFIDVADSLEWPLLIVGAAGTGSIFYSSWRESRRRRPRRREGRAP